MTNLISKPGCYDLSAEAYHADPCRTPSLSRSIAVMLLTGTPRRAAGHHPRLNPDLKRENKKIFDLGAAAHALVLDDHADFLVIKSPNYKSHAAQMKRDLAYASGRIPVLQDDLERVKGMVVAARAQLCVHENASTAFLEGKPEQTLIWKEKIDGIWVWFRIRLDWLPLLGGWLDDYKSSGAATNPGAWINRVLYPEGLDIQVALYIRGYTAVFGVPPAGFRFIVQSTEEPYELFTVVLTRADQSMAERDLNHAIDLWAWCMKNGKWPGHAARDHKAERGVWRERMTIEREDRELAASQSGQDLKKLMMNWQSPLDRPFKIKKGKTV